VHIFIDESGAFVRPRTGASKAACVGALMVRSDRLEELSDAFSRLRRQFSSEDAELKGSALTERQVAQIIATLRRFDVVFDATVIDIGNQDPEQVRRVKERQVQMLVEGPGATTDANIAARVRALCDAMLGLSDQLFVQVFVTISLIARILETSTLYYVQRAPAELGAFHWRIDAKDPRRRTSSEQVWTTIVAPVLQDDSRKRPLPMLQGADYSHFGRFLRHFDGLRPDEVGVDVQAILAEDRQFLDSRDDIGLQIVDCLSNSLTRALNGKLRVEGWGQLGRLMVHRTDMSVHVVELDSRANEARRRILYSPFALIVRLLESRMKPMLVP
jgi:Protein of unknown function (DUF3800)